MERITKEQAAIILGYTGIHMGEMSLFHKMVEEKLGRPVWTHQFGNKALWEDEIKPAFKKDFEAIVYKEES